MSIIDDENKLISGNIEKLTNEINKIKLTLKELKETQNEIIDLIHNEINNLSGRMIREIDDLHNNINTINYKIDYLMDINI